MTDSEILEQLQEKKSVIDNNPIKQVLMNHEPVDDVLHVISVYFNPCQSKRRIQLMNEFIERMAMEEDERQE